MTQSASNSAVQSRISVLFLSCPNGLSVEGANLENHQLAYLCYMLNYTLYTALQG